MLRNSMKKKFAAALIAMGLGITALTGCSDAETASKNVSTAADNFKVNRQIVFYNGINGEYIAVVNGLCSVDASTSKLAVICKVGNGKYIKNYLGLADNIGWFALQTSPVHVSSARYDIVFKPSTVIPDIDVH